MKSININNLMSFKDKDHFWKLIFGKLSESILNGYKFTIIFSLDEIIGEVYKVPDEYSFTIEEDQYSYFLNNYLKWCEGLERFEECQNIINLLSILKDKHEHLRG